MQDIAGLQRLRQLDVQSNRLTRIGPCLESLSSLEELLLSHNGISVIEGLPVHAPLTLLDLSSNKLVSPDGAQYVTSLEELWVRATRSLTLWISYLVEQMSSNYVERFEDLQCLRGLPKLSCVYLEHNPVSRLLLLLRSAFAHNTLFQDIRLQKTIDDHVPHVDANRCNNSAPSHVRALDHNTSLSSMYERF
jgi:Leucine-rich repeat (LRR) protein